MNTRMKLPTILFCLMFPAASARAADLRPETLKAWNECVRKTEQRIGSELSSTEGFLALDFRNPRDAVRERRQIHSGEIPVTQISSSNECQGIGIPDGMLHHWRGSVFIPGVTLDTVFSRISNPGQEETRQEDVLESKVLEKKPGELKLFLKLQRSKIVTVRYNTEHVVRYRRTGPLQASSSSTATRIAEIDQNSGSREREKPVGHDSGYLWKMNSYWRYQQVAGGVIVECESMTLSRSIPSMLEYVVRPLIRSVARESMRRTLGSMRDRMKDAADFTDSTDPKISPLPRGWSSVR